MKRVHSGRQLLHLFCNMTNADLEGFRTSSRNIYFENGVLFSYGTHYPMARKTSFGTGTNYREIILINSERSTVTTQKHKAQLRGSVKSSQWVFCVPNIIEPRAVENSEHLMNEIVDAISSVLRCHKYSSVDYVTRKIGDHNQYAKSFNLKAFNLDSEFYAILAVLSRDTEKRNEVKSKQKNAKQDAERAAHRAMCANEVELWYTCKNTMNISSAYFDLGYDPIRVNGDIVESPRGVKVSLREAQEFARLLELGRVQIGMKVSEFTVESMDSEFIQIGCHKLNIKQAVKAVLGDI